MNVHVWFGNFSVVALFEEMESWCLHSSDGLGVLGVCALGISRRCWLGSGTDLWGLPWRFVQEAPAQVAGAVPTRTRRCSGTRMTAWLRCRRLLHLIPRRHTGGCPGPGPPAAGQWGPPKLEVPESPLVGLVVGSGFPGWPAQLWLGRCGMK